MYHRIKNKFGSQYAKRNISWSKVKLCRVFNDYLKYIESYMDLIDAGGGDTTYYMNDIEANFYVYSILVEKELNEVRNVDKVLNAGIKLMEGVVRRADNFMQTDINNPRGDSLLTKKWKSMKIDTYASLLFKCGKVNEAIKWESEALGTAQSINDRANISFYKNKIAAWNKSKL